MLEDQISRKATTVLRLAFAVCLACWAWFLPSGEAACNSPGVADYELSVSASAPASPVYVPVETSVTFKATVKASVNAVNALLPTPIYQFEFVWSNSPPPVSGSQTYTTECSAPKSWDIPGHYQVTLMASNPPDDYSTSSFCTASAEWDVYVLKVDIEQMEMNVCWKMTNTMLNLTSSSYWAPEMGGDVLWSSTPAGLSPSSGTGSNFTFNPSLSTPKPYVVTARASLLNDCLDTCTVRVLKVDIEPTNTNVCWKMTNAVLKLTSSSYWAKEVGGDILWSSSSGLSPSSGTGSNFTFNPSLSTPGTYVVTARSSLLNDCLDTCTVTVFKVEYTLDHVCVITSHPPHEVTVTTTPTPLPSGVTVDLELRANNGSTASAIFTNSGVSTIGVTGTINLAVLGTLASDPVSNMVMEAKWAGSVCTSVAFTVVDVRTLTGTEVLHANNTKSDSTQADDTNAVLICQTSNNTAKLELGLTWLPADYPASTILWKAYLASGQAASEWGGPGDFTSSPTNLTWTPGAASNREFRIYGWFDCEEEDYASTEPHRVLDVTVVELAGLAISNAAGSNVVEDLTRADEPTTAANTLYLCEGSNGTAEMTIRADWLPGTVSGAKFRWEIVKTNEAATTQWAPNNQTFGLNPATGVIWSVTGPDREFLVRAWYDCNGNGAYDADEPHRSAFVTVLKVESVGVHTNDLETAKVQSFQAGGMDHFVCPKNTGDVILDAELAPNIAAAADAITWEADGATITSPAVGTDKTTAKLPSATSQKIPVRIKVGTCICWSGTVWVVWSNPAISNTPNTEMVFIAGNQTRLRMQSPPIAFFFEITPSEITDNTKDVPNFSGTKYSDPPDGVHWDGVSHFTGGADKKWDISRQMNTKFLSSIADTNVQKQVLDNDPFYNNRPTAFPSDPVLGNDDPFTGGEDNDPYTAANIGRLTATDNPTFRADSDSGNVGDTMEIRLAMKEFTRLNLSVFGGPKWFAVSDHDQAKWKYFLKWIKKDESVDNVDYNGDGDKNDQVWINYNSVVAHDHVGF